MSSLVTSLMTENLTVTRYDNGTWVNGRYIKGDESCTEFVASVQPLTANEAKQLPEHRRNEETLKIYTCERLYPPDEKAQKPGDEVIHDGKKYEILKVSNWSIGTDLPHYKCIAVMQDGEGAGRGQ